MAETHDPILIDTETNARLNRRRDMDNLNNSREILSKAQQNYGRDLASISTKDLVQSVSNLQKQFNDLEKTFSSLDKNVFIDFNKSLKQLGLNIKDSDKVKESFSDLTKIALSLKNSFEALNKEGATDLNTALDLKEKATLFQEQLDSIATFFEEFRSSNGKNVKSLQKTLQGLIDSLAQTKNDLDNKATEIKAAKTIVDDAKNIQKQSLDQLSRDFNELRRTLDLSTLAKQFAPSSKAILQGDLQSTFNLTSKQFNSFKQDLYDQIDTSLYTAEEIQSAMATLNTTALGSTQTATEYFDDILRGQKVLGATLEEQQTLLRLGTMTGRNELSFYQGTVAKFLNSSLGLNKQQLNELVSINANLQMQAVDLGIATDAYGASNMNALAAMEATETGAAQKLASAESFLLQNTNATSSLLGMDSGEFAQRMANGETLVDMFQNARTGTGAATAMTAWQNGDSASLNRLKENAADAWGADNADVWSVLRIIATQNSELNKNLATTTEASIQDAEEALKSIEEKQFEATTEISHGINLIQNQLDRMLDWKIMEGLAQIAGLIGLVITVLKTGHDITGLLGNLVGKGGAAGGAGGLIGKIGSIGGGSGSLGSALINGAGIVGGVVATGAMLYDGINVGKSGFRDENGQRIEGTSGWKNGLAGAVTNQDINATKGQNIGSAALKGAGVGAAIGTFVGGPVGTVVGGLIGGAVGGIAGLWGNKQKEDARKQQETLEEIKLNTETTAENTAKTADSLGMVYRYRGLSTVYMGSTGPSSSIISGMGATSGGSSLPAGIHVNSSYGERPPIKLEDGSWTKPFHNGIDLRADEGTPLYSNVSGKVTLNKWESGGGNIVAVTDSNNYSHLYAHMKIKSPLPVGTPVRAGQFIGYSGKTGKNVTGPHLHYSVIKPGGLSTYWERNSVVDPTPFITSNIFSGTGVPVSGYTTSSMATSGLSVSESLTDNITKVNLSKASGATGPIVDSIHNLRDTIVALSAQVNQNQKIMNMLTNRAMESPTV